MSYEKIVQIFVGVWEEKTGENRPFLIRVCAIFAHTAEDSKSYNTQFYNLDTIISVGYRVNSVEA